MGTTWELGNDKGTWWKFHVNIVRNQRNITRTCKHHENMRTRHGNPFKKKYCTYNWCSTLAFVLVQSPFATHPPKQLFHVQIKLQVIFAHNLNITHEFSMAKSKTKGLMPISFGSDYMRGIDELVCTIMPFMLAWYGLLWTRDFHHPSSHLPPWSIIWKIQGPLHCGWDFP